MISPYVGHRLFLEETIETLAPKSIGVYYCGAINSQTKSFVIHYIGRSIEEDGIQGRLLDHNREDKWSDVTHFGYELCSTEKEVIDHEKAEIKLHKPKYNELGK